MAKLSPQKDKFCDLMAEGGRTATEAAEEAGYSGTSLHQMASRLKRELAKEIEERLRLRITDQVPMALSGLVTLAKSAESETVKLAALRDLIDRGGFKPVEQREDLTPQKDRTMLKAELDQLVGQERVEDWLNGEKTKPALEEPEDGAVVVPADQEKPNELELPN